MNSQELMDSIKSRAFVPVSQSTFSTSDLLGFATDIMRTRIVPFVIRFQEDYFLKEEITDRVPSRALGGKIKNVALISDSGCEIQLPRLEPCDLGKSLQGFVLKGNQIILNCTPRNSNRWMKPKVSYYVRPSHLVLPELACRVISMTGNDVEVDQIPPGLELGSVLDFIGGEPTFDYLGSAYIQNISGKTLSLSSIPKEIEKGALNVQWMARLGESPVPQIPLELHPLLAQSVACQLLESLGFEDKAAAAQRVLERMESDVIPVISPRVDDSRKRIINRSQLVRFS